MWPHHADKDSRLCRCAQVGTGSRAEKIKTYNYKDSRMSDHRTKQNFDLNRVLEGDLEENIQSLITLDQQERLQEMAEAVKVPA